MIDLLLKAGRTGSEIEFAKLDFTIKNVDSTLGNLNQIRKALEMGLTTMDKANSMTKEFSNIMQERFGVSAEAVNRLTMEHTFLLDSINRTSKATNLMNQALLGVNRVTDIEGNIRNLINGLQNMSGVASGQASRSIIGYAAEIKRLATKFGDVETAALSVEQIALRLGGVFLEFGSGAAIDYASALDLLESQLNVMASNLNNTNSAFGQTNESILTSRNLLQELRSQIASGNIDTELWANLMSLLGPKISQVTGAMDDLVDEEGNSIIKTNKISEAMAALAGALADVNLTKLDEELGKAANSFDDGAEGANKLGAAAKNNFNKVLS